MSSKSLQDALDEAGHEPSPQGGGVSQPWETDDYEIVIVKTNSGKTFKGAPKIGLQLQRSTDSRRIWADLVFDVDNKQGMKMTARKLRDFGVSEIAGELNDSYPNDEDLPQLLEALHPHFLGIKAEVNIKKSETSAPDATEKRYKNYLQYVKRLLDVSDDSAEEATDTGLSGLMG